MHIPVLLEESISFLNAIHGGVLMDCTFGGGGHAIEILKKMEAPGSLIALDRDVEAVDRGLSLEAEHPNLKVLHRNFTEVKDVAIEEGVVGKVNGILADLGTSMFQLKDPGRGFSFSTDGPLDMRMDTSTGLTAADILNSYEEEELIRIFRDYGEERYARRIAREVLARRKRSPYENTLAFARQIEDVYGGRRGRIHPATRCFQALRIAVNEELESLPHFLDSALEVLAQGGRMVVISFHSLEDRIVKNFFRDKSRNCICPPSQARCTCGGNNAQVQLLTRKVVRPSQWEVDRNPASRSSRLRAAEKLGVPS
ncbi:MAG: 16S rRNA (cytosine(1402)-N(4))-methyltransferase RsmH [Acidobacteria bacterium]|nr:16S rRNA (cytosine(1402)-N(4))-methyltransferase RsmH [Acidobacteriota bacterium]